MDDFPVKHDEAEQSVATEPVLRLSLEWTINLPGPVTATVRRLTFMNTKHFIVAALFPCVVVSQGCGGSRVTTPDHSDFAPTQLPDLDEWKHNERRFVVRLASDGTLTRDQTVISREQLCENCACGGRSFFCCVPDRWPS